jgi:hypothetical protein
MGGIAEGSFIPSWAGEAGGRQKDFRFHTKRGGFWAEKPLFWPKTG